MVDPRVAGAAMRRREFITLLSGLVMWPLMVRAQQLPDRIRKIGVLMIVAEAEAQMRAFRQGLARLGWEIVALTGDKLKLTNPVASTGGGTTEVVFTRAK
jgi:hypothetical protein